MTLNYPASDATPTTFGAQPQDAQPTPYSAAETATYDEPIDEMAVPVYARKPAKKSGIPKVALIAVPVVLAMGIGAWALTAGNSSREAEAPAADTSTLTTSRLDVTQPVSPEVAAPAVTEAVPAATAPAPAPVLRPAAVPAPAARVARASTPAPTARRTAAPARRTSAAPAPAATVPAAPQPYNAGALTTVITEPTPAPAVIAPTPVLPVEPTPPETPPATTTPPGGEG